MKTSDLVKTKLKKYCSLYGASLSEMKAIAFKESSNNPDIGLHPDGVSYGLMGITPIVVTEFKNFTGSQASRENVSDNIQIACWYWGIRIPQMLKYFDQKNSLRNRVICYNAGINYVVKQSELPARTIAYISYMQDLKKKSLFSLLGVSLAVATFKSWR